MAFTIVTADKARHTWHARDAKPKFPAQEFTKSIVVMLQAEGEELDLICARFRHVPHSFGTCTWRDEMAQFIYDNL